MNYQEWMAEAISEIEKLGAGKVFEAKELFRLQKWNDLSAGDKRAFGRYFSNEYKEGRIRGIAKISEGKNHHTRYRKL